MTTRGEINSNFYQIVNVDSNGAPTEIKPEYIPAQPTANYAAYAGNITIASQPNITSTGTLTGLTSNGVINFSNASNVTLGSVGNLHISGGTPGYVLGTDGAGTLSWVAGGGGGGGSPGGANTFVQFNDGGTFGGVAEFTFDKTTNVLTATNFSGNGSQLTDLNIANISGLGNIATINLDGNVSNILHGDGSWSGDIAGNANYAAYAGNVTIAAQPNITSLGTLTSLDVSGNATIGNITNVDSVTFDTANVPATVSVAQLSWNDGQGTLDLGLKGGNITALIGQQEYARVYNDEITSLVKGEIVYVNGAQGNLISVKRAQANTEATSVGTLGMVAETIAAGGEGFIQTTGAIYKLNTNGLTAGNAIYLSPSVAGGYTQTKPVAPDQLVILGWVERVSTTVGSIYLKVDNGYELDELHNVLISSPVAGEALVYNASNLWVNGNPANATHASTANTVTDAAQPNITSTGTLVSLDVTGNLSSGNANLGNLATANFFSGNGSLLTGITATASPGGNTTEIQFNNAGVLDGSPVLTYNINTNTSNIKIAPSSGLTFTRAASLELVTPGGVGNIVRVANTLSINDTNSFSIVSPIINLGSNSNVKITGGSSTQVLSTDGLGNLSWVSSGGATPAGANTQIQFNDGTNFAASANLTFINTTNTLSTTNLTVTNTANIANLTTNKYSENVQSGGSVSGTITPDVALGTIFNYTLTGSITLNALGNAVAGSGCTLILTQGGSGSYTLTSTMKFAGGTKTLSTSVGAIDIVSVFYDGTTYYATLAKGFA